MQAEEKSLHPKIRKKWYAHSISIGKTFWHIFFRGIFVTRSEIFPFFMLRVWKTKTGELGTTTGQ